MEAARDACLVACPLLLSCFGRLGFITALSEHLNQLSPGPPLCGGVAHFENINAKSGSKTRLPAIIRQHFACISRSPGPRTPDPKLERSMVIKVTQTPTLGRGAGVEKSI